MADETTKRGAASAPMPSWLSVILAEAQPKPASRVAPASSVQTSQPDPVIEAAPPEKTVEERAREENDAAQQLFERRTARYTRDNDRKAGIRHAARHIFPWAKTTADLDREIVKLFSAPAKNSALKL